MTIWMIVLAVLLVVVVCVLLSYILGEVEVSQHEAQIEAVLHIRALYGLVHMRKRLLDLNAVMTPEGPAVEAVHNTSSSVEPVSDAASTSTAKSSKPHKHVLTTEEVFQFISHWREWLTLFRRIQPPMHQLLARVDVSVFELNIGIGVGDPVATGCLVGVIWSVVGVLTGSIGSLVRFTAVPSLAVNPDFQNLAFHLNGRCIGRLRVGYAILAAVRMLVIWKQSPVAHIT